MKLKCSYADKYKAIKAPTCGCKVCNDKWDEKNKVSSSLSEAEAYREAHGHYHYIEDRYSW